MRVDNVDIDTFSPQEEYRGQSFHPGGETTLIHGPNRTGKTLTFCAIGYPTLDETWGARRGTSAKVVVDFSDGTRFTASAGGHRYRTPQQEFTGQDARDKLHEEIGASRFVTHHFLHSRAGELPLEALSGSEVLDRVREAAVPDLQEEIGETKLELSRIETRIEELEDREQAIGERVPEIDTRIESLEAEIAEEERIVELRESGELAAIRDTLEEHADLDEELQDLSARRDELEDELKQVRRRREHLQSGDSTTHEQVPVAALDRDCPVCEETVIEAEARARLDEGLCPLCRRDTEFTVPTVDLDDDPDGDDEAADVEELTDQIETLEADLQTVIDRIEAVKSEQPGLSGLDDDIRTRFERHERDVDVVVQAAKAEIDRLEAHTESLEDRREQLVMERERVRERIPELRAEREETAAEFRERQAAAKAALDDFQERWTENFRRMCPTLAIELRLWDGDGIVTQGSPKRVYGDGDNLSAAERQLVNLSFGVTLHETLDDDRVALDTFVLDELFGNLDDDATEELSNFVRNDEERQYIFTSSNSDVRSQFSTVVELSRQTELGEFGDEDDS